MAFERPKAVTAARVPELDRAVERPRREPGRVVGEGHRVYRTAMALERPKAVAAARVPNLDRAVVRPRCEPGRVVGEGHRAYEIAMALERLKAGAPIFFYSRLYRNPLWFFSLEKISYQALGWTENECGHVCLERTILYCPFVVHN